jgi:heptosyltransferase II
MNNSRLPQTLKEAEIAALGTVLKVGLLARCRVWVFDALLYPYFRLTSLFDRKARKPVDDEIRKILIVEYANFGDIVLLLPFLQNLRVHYPEAHVTLLANPKTGLLLKGLSLVDEIIPIQVPQGMFFARRERLNLFSPLWRDARRGLRRLRGLEFDLAITARIDVMDNWMLWMTGARRRMGYGLKGGRFFLTDVVKPDLDHVHGADRWLAVFRTLGKPVVERVPRLTTLQDEERMAADYLEARGVNQREFVVGFHPGARTAIRQWGVENFRQVAQRAGSEFAVKILWFEDPTNSDVKNEAPEGAIPARVELRLFMALLSRCRIFVCNDSGPMHIASALGVPVVSIFGPTKLEWFGPLGSGHRVVIRNGFWCRPCGDRCIFDQPYCLRTITTNEVFDPVAEVILSLGGRRRVGEIFSISNSSGKALPVEARL